MPPRNRQTWIVAAGLGALLLAVAVLGRQPFRTVERLSGAVERGDNRMAWEMVDRQAVLEDQIRRQGERMEADVAQGNTASPFLRLGPSMATLMVERAAWEAAQPEAILGALRLPDGTSALDDASVEFLGPGSIRVSPKASGAPVLVMARRGWGWKVVQIQQPAP